MKVLVLLRLIFLVAVVAAIGVRLILKLREEIALQKKKQYGVMILTSLVWLDLLDEEFVF